MTGLGAFVPALLTGAAIAVAGGQGAGSALRLQTAVDTPGRPPPLGSARPGRLPLGGLGVAVVAITLVALGPAAALLAGCAVPLVVRAVRAQARGRESVRERRHAGEACAALAAELRSGRDAAAALAVAADLAQGSSRSALRAAAAAATWGGDVPAALLAPGPLRSTAVPEVLRGLAACWQVCSRAGSGLALSVERLADGLRARQVQERAVAAALAGPRASSALLAGLPLGGIALAAGLGAHPVHVLLHTPLGLGCTVGGAGLDALGLWWTGRIVERAARSGT